MSSGSALSFGIIAVVVAVAALAGAILLVIAARRARDRVRHAAIVLTETAVEVRRGSVHVREATAEAMADMERAARAVRAMDQQMEVTITTMAQRRTEMEHLDRRRLAPAIRLLQVVGTAARVAVLWR